MKRLFTSLILLFLLNGLPGHSAPDRKKGESAYSPGMVAVDITTLKPLSEADSVVRGAVYAGADAVYFGAERLGIARGRKQLDHSRPSQQNEIICEKNGVRHTIGRRFAYHG